MSGNTYGEWECCNTGKTVYIKDLYVWQYPVVNEKAATLVKLLTSKVSMSGNTYGEWECCNTGKTVYIKDLYVWQYPMVNENAATLVRLLTSKTSMSGNILWWMRMLQHW